MALSGFLFLLGPSSATRLTLRGSSRAITHTDGDTEIPGYAIEILGMKGPVLKAYLDIFVCLQDLIILGSNRYAQALFGSARRRSSGLLQ